MYDVSKYRLWIFPDGFSMLNTILLGCITLLLPLQPVAGQETDTLAYFDPSTTPEDITVLGNITDMGVYFVPDSSWENYSINQIEILISEPVFNQTVSLSLRSDSTGYPGPVLTTLQLSFDDTTVTYPQWYPITIPPDSGVLHRSGPFWVTGSALFYGMAVYSDTGFQHTFAYEYGLPPCDPCWNGPTTGFDLVVKTIVIRDALSIHTEAPSMINNYTLEAFPNPFNSTVVFQVPENIDPDGMTLKIVDVYGREVFRHSINSPTIRWTGTTEQGMPLSSGIYFVLLQTGHQVVLSRKISYLK